MKNNEVNLLSKRIMTNNDTLIIIIRLDLLMFDSDIEAQACNLISKVVYSISKVSSISKASISKLEGFAIEESFDIGVTVTVTVTVTVARFQMIS